MNNPEWRDGAQCAGLPLSAIDVSTYAKAERDTAARRICEGCPVIADCRANTLENWDGIVGVILGGVAIPNQSNSSKRRRALRALRAGMFISPPKPKPAPKPESKSDESQPKPKRRPTHCVQCTVSLAPARTTIDQIPEGYRVHRGRGLCDACYSRARRNGGQLTPASGSRGRSMKFTHCTVCSRALRPSNRLVRDYPNTVQHIGGGICSGCNATQRRNAERQDVA